MGELDLEEIARKYKRSQEIQKLHDNHGVSFQDRQRVNSDGYLVTEVWASEGSQPASRVGEYGSEIVQLPDGRMYRNGKYIGRR